MVVKRRFVFLVLFCISVNIFAQEHKNALLIANNIYETPEKDEKLKSAQNQNLDENLLLFHDLKTPIKEAYDLRDVLQELGFTVTLLENADKKQIRKALRDFQGKTKSEKGIAFFHYGGHAVQINGENYLIPAKNDVVSNSDISDEAVKVANIIDSMHGENNVVVLDACRVIPYRSTGTRGGSGSVRGLASIALSKPNFIVIHSASSGESAVDGVFTPIFTQRIKEKKSLTTILMEVRTDVHRVARNQNPEDRSQLTQDIFLAGYENNVLAISGTTGKLEISVISPCSVFLDENKITELNAFETKVIDVPTGTLSIKAKYSDGYETVYQRIVKTNGKESVDFQYAMKSETEKCYELGQNYYYGRNGSKKDYGKAFEYYSIAAKSEHTDAQNMLGICYENGNGHSKNEKEALAWYKKAANNGNRCAMGNAGLCYEYGKGTSVNYKEAKRWYEKAVSNGNSDAHKYLTSVNNKIEEENARKLISESAKTNSNSSSSNDYRQSYNASNLNDFNFVGLKAAYAYSRFNVEDVTSFTGNGLYLSIPWIDIRKNLTFQLGMEYSHCITSLMDEDLTYDELDFLMLKFGKSFGERFFISTGCGYGLLWESAYNGQKTTGIFNELSIPVTLEFRLSNKWFIFAEYAFTKPIVHFPMHSFRAGIEFFIFSKGA